MRKRISRRRWKARCRLGCLIPREAIVNHDLTQWYTFRAANRFDEMYIAIRNEPSRALLPASDGTRERH